MTTNDKEVIQTVEQEAGLEPDIPKPPKGKQFKNMTREELSACGKAGAKKSTEVRRRKKAMKETLESMLAMKLHPGRSADVEKIGSLSDIKGQNISVEAAMLFAQIQKALKGDTEAAKYLRDTAGQKPADESKLDVSLTIPVFSGEDDLPE